MYKKLIAFCGMTLVIVASSLVGSNTIEGRVSNEAPVALTERPDGAGRIAFVSTRGGNRDIYVMLPDGSNLVNLTNHPQRDEFPAWSPDGSKIVFRSTRDGNREIYTMNDDGSGVVRLTVNPALDTTPSWTPEGRIVFSSNRSGRFELYEMNADGSGLSKIEIELDGSLLVPRVSPVGHRIAFTHQTFDGDIQSAVWIAHRDGSHATQLTPDELHADAPAWSPNGNRLSFSDNFCFVCGPNHVFVMNQGGHVLRQLTQGVNEADFNSSWSPDGSQIVVERLTLSTGQFDIYVMNADGTDVTNISMHPAFDFSPAWGP